MKIKALILILFLVNKGQAQWSQITAPTSNFIKEIVFVSSTTGFCSSVDGVFRTTNAGTTWLLMPSSPSGGRFSFVTSSLGYMVNSTDVFKTSDGGANWTSVYDITSTGETLRDVCFVSSNVGYIISSFYNNPSASHIYKTTNGGTTWAKTHSFPGLVTAEAIEFVGSTLGFVVGYNGTVIRTTNAGLTWTSQNTNAETLHSVCFVNSMVGYACGYTNFSGADVIKTVDGGTTWQLLSTGGNFNESLRGIYFHSVDTGYAVGANGRIIRTFDGGQNWETTPCPVNEFLSDVFFTSALTGFAVGDNGAILKTTNGGLIGIEELEIDQVAIYPNPARDIIKIETTKEYVRVVDVTGKQVDVKSNREGTKLIIHAGELNGGTYFVYVGDSSKPQKMLISK